MRPLNTIYRYVLFVVMFLLTGCTTASTIIDTHAHMNVSANTTAGCNGAYAALIPLVTGYMDQYNIKKSIIMSQPLNSFVLDSPPFCKHYKYMGPSLEPYHDRFLFLGGGASLNPMLKRYADPATVTPAIRSRFKFTAYEILEAGAIGFGEITTEHFSLVSGGHHYQSVAADHPLMLLLADIAAYRNVPIDLHMEALPLGRIPLPKWLQRLNDNPVVATINPSHLYKNIDKLENLLRHNRGARIVWVHAAWDNSSYRLVGVMKRLLDEHPNLYMSIKQRSRPPYNQSQPQHFNTPQGHPGLRTFNRVLDNNDRLKNIWLKLFKEFPDRFMIGQDQHFPNNYEVEAMDRMNALLSQLPSGLRDKIAGLNALRIYNISN